MKRGQFFVLRLKKGSPRGKRRKRESIFSGVFPKKRGQKKFLT
jgi:hypothetical protein